MKFYQRQEVKDIIAYLRLIANHDDDVSLNRVINLPTRGIGQRTSTISPEPQETQAHRSSQLFRRCRARQQRRTQLSAHSRRERVLRS